MKPFEPTLCVLATVVATVMSLRGVRKKSLSPSGAIAAWIVGFLMVGCGLRGFVLIAFYLAGTKATKYKAEIKAKRDATAGHDSIRGAPQVLASSILAVICSLVHAIYCGQERAVDFDADPLASSLTCAILAHHATCLGDTWASEMGILSQSQPILITKPWKHVPPGTNGGISLGGTLWSALGGTLMATSTILMDWISKISLSPVSMIVHGTTCGFLGSLVDSLLGATLQASYWDPDTKMTHQVTTSVQDLSPSVKHISGINVLSNAQVNLVSVGLTIVLGGWVLGPIVFSLF